MQFTIIAKQFPFVKCFSIIFSKFFLYNDISAKLCRFYTKDAAYSVENLANKFCKTYCISEKFVL